MELDVVKKKKANAKKSPVWIGAVVVAIAVLIYLLQPSVDTSVDEQDILIVAVQKGDLVISINGFGTLESNQYRLLTARSAATVKEILLYPGAIVGKDDTIAVLENPELEQEVFEAKQDYEFAVADYEQLKTSQAMELLQENSQVIELQALYEQTKLKRQANEELVKDGIVSNIEYRSNLLQEKQLSNRVELVQDRINKLEELHQQSLSVQQKRVNLAKAKLQLVEGKLDSLFVKSGLDGVLQNLPVSIGQSITMGQEIALIGSVEDLKATIQIPQNQASDVSIDQVVTIDTRREKISGVVSRVEPIVKDNTITVEVKLTGKIPASARPKQNVSGEIFIEDIDNTFYIERPSSSSEGQTVYLFKLDDSSNSAEKVKVELGKKAGNYIEIKSAVEAGERFIISELPRNVMESSSLKIL